MEVEMTWKNESRFVQEGNRVKNLTYEGVKDSFEAIRASFRKREKALFQTEGDTGEHGHWPPLSPAYLAWKKGLRKVERKANKEKGVKQKLSVSTAIMVFKGALKKSLTENTDGTIGYVAKVAGNKFYLHMGSDVKSEGGFDYPKHHQEYAAKRRRTIDPTDFQLQLYARILQNGVIIQARKYKTLFDIANDNQMPLPTIDGKQI